MELRGKEDMAIFTHVAKQKYIIVKMLIRDTTDDAAILRGILFYYDNYDQDKNIKKDIMCQVEKINLDEKKSLLGELAREIYNRDCIFHLKMGKEVPWKMKDGLYELEKQLY